MRARFYDPRSARFLSADTVVPDPKNPQALNRYSYVIGNPMRYRDPSGHGPFDNLTENINVCLLGIGCPNPFPNIVTHGLTLRRSDFAGPEFDCRRLGTCFGDVDGLSGPFKTGLSYTAELVGSMTPFTAIPCAVSTIAADTTCGGRDATLFDKIVAPFDVMPLPVGKGLKAGRGLLRFGDDAATLAGRNAEEFAAAANTMGPKGQVTVAGGNLEQHAAGLGRRNLGNAQSKNALASSAVDQVLTGPDALVEVHRTGRFGPQTIDITLPSGAGVRFSVNDDVLYFRHFLGDVRLLLP